MQPNNDLASHIATARSILSAAPRKDTSAPRKITSALGQPKVKDNQTRIAALLNS
jgi:hypothetical protein